MKNPAVNNIKNSEKNFLYGSIIIIAVFLLTRLQYYLYYPIVDISADSASYCAVAIKLMNFSPPLLDMRTPGYPLFLSLVWFISKNFIVTYFFQSLMTLSAAIFLYRTFCKYYDSFAVYFAIAISVFISSSFCLVLEFSLLSESLFVCFLLISSSFLIRSIMENSASDWTLFSFSVVTLIYIRPVALFFIPVIFIILIYFFINKYSIKFYLSIVIPLSVFIIVLCTYNYFTLNKFTVSPAGDLSFFACTILFMEESPDYPPEINSAIKTTLDSIPKKEKAYVRDPKELSKLNRIFNDNLFRSWRFVGFVMKENNQLTYMDIHPYLVKITRDAIKRNPEIYARIIISNIYQFIGNISDKLFLYSNLERSYKRIYLDKYYIEMLEDDWWEQFYSDKTSAGEVIDLYNMQFTKFGDFKYVRYEGGSVILEDNLLKQIYIYIERFNNFVFRNMIWLLFFLITFIYSSFRVIKSKFKDPVSFIAFIFCAIFIANALFISILGTAITRYSYTVEFVIYLSLPLFIHLIKKSKSDNIKTDIL